MAREDVTRTLTHVCQFGMKSNIGGKGSELGPVLKPTGFMTNSPCIGSQLARVCPGDHKHVHLVGGRAAGAAIYPPGLCRAICRGLAAQLHEDRIGKVRKHPTHPFLNKMMPISIGSFVCFCFFSILCNVSNQWRKVVTGLTWCVTFDPAIHNSIFSSFR